MLLCQQQQRLSCQLHGYGPGKAYDDLPSSPLPVLPAAPGSQRLRDIINKGLTNEELLRGVKTAWQQGWKQVKLYFMIGLPGETDEDVMGIVDTIQWIQRECRWVAARELDDSAARCTQGHMSPHGVTHGQPCCDICHTPAGKATTA
jgi:hypothetical protein